MRTPRSAKTPTKHRRSRRLLQQAPGCKLSQGPNPRRRLTKGEELADCSSTFRTAISGLEDDHRALLVRESSYQGSPTERSIVKLLNAIKAHRKTVDDLWNDQCWVPTKYGAENDDFDFTFLSSLWSCASLSEKVDIELQKVKHETMGWGRVLSRSSEARPIADQVGLEEVAEVLERLRVTSKAGQRVRVLVPACPQRKPRPRTKAPRGQPGAAEQGPSTPTKSAEPCRPHALPIGSPVPVRPRQQ